MRILMALVMAATMTAPALAAEPSQIRVSLAGLDLATSKGQHALDHRLWVATMAMCSAPAAYTAEEAREISSCKAEVMKSVSSQINLVHGRSVMAIASSR